MSDRLDELLLAHEEDRLDEAGCAELTARLAGDPAARRRLVGHWSLSSALASRLRRQAAPVKDGWREHTARHLASRRRRFGRRRQTLWPLLAAAGLLLGLGGAWWSLSAGPDRPTGVATVLAATGCAQQPGTRLDGAAVLDLPQGAELRLRLDGGADLTCAGGSKLQGLSADGLMLTTGRIDCVVEPRPTGGTPFAVRTPQGLARVMGTRFRVSATAQRAQVQVTAGRVRIERPDGAQALLAAGEHGELRPDRLPVPLRTWGPGDQEALLLTIDASASRDEELLLTRLRSLGLRPQVARAELVDPAAVDRARLTVLSNRLPLPALERRLPRPTCPLLVLEPGAWQVYGLSASPARKQAAGGGMPQAFLKPHPITAGLKAGKALLPTGVELILGADGPEALFGWTGDGGGSLISIREPGETLADGSPCPQRRVGLFVLVESLPRLNADGWRAVDQAVRWAAELDDR